MPGKYRNKVRIQHMIDAANRIDSYVGNSSKENFDSDPKPQDACIRQLQIIGEAANRMTTDFQKNQTDIPWPKIVGLRNVVVHDYEGVDTDIIWNIIENDLPQLWIELQSLEQLLPDDED